MKKGQIEIQFNWIFVLIVGAIILGFFLVVVKAMGDKGEYEEATGLIQDLDSVFTSISKESNAVDEFDIPRADITFVCEEGLSHYFIQGTGPKPTTYDVIFSPAELKGDKIITWTKTWDIPYEAAIFMYMANERTMFIFMNVTNDNRDVIITRLYNGMPDEFAKIHIRHTDLAGTKLSGYDRYVFLSHSDSLGMVQSTVNGWTHDDKSVIRSIAPDIGGGSFGQVTFATPFSIKDTKPYFLDASIYGSLLTEDSETYMCTMDKALFKAKVIGKILFTRADMIIDEMVTSKCYSEFALVKDRFNLMLLAIDTFNVLDMWTAMDDLEQSISDSYRGPDCPSLY